MIFANENINNSNNSRFKAMDTHFSRDSDDPFSIDPAPKFCFLSFNWLRVSEQLGQRALGGDGTMVLTGGSDVGKPSLLLANNWYRRAILAGDPRAKNFLDRLRAEVSKRAALGDELAEILVIE